MIHRTPRTRKALETFGRNLRVRRKKLGLSQMLLADLTGHHFTFIGRVERAECNISLASIVKLAKGLDCKAAELLAGI